jgi:hypothetical protein
MGRLNSGRDRAFPGGFFVGARVMTSSMATSCLGSNCLGSDREPSPLCRSTTGNIALCIVDRSVSYKQARFIRSNDCTLCVLGPYAVVVGKLRIQEEFTPPTFGFSARMKTGGIEAKRLTKSGLVHRAPCRPSLPVSDLLMSLTSTEH